MVTSAGYQTYLPAWFQSFDRCLLIHQSKYFDIYSKISDERSSADVVYTLGVSFPLESLLLSSYYPLCPYNELHHGILRLH